MLLPTPDRPIVLFLCACNSARSQMAEAFLRKHAGDRFDSHSAGLEPREIHPLTLKVMDEEGISIKGHRPKSLSEYLARVATNYVIFVCEPSERSCPRIWPFAFQTYRFPVPDPTVRMNSEEVQIKLFRRVRDEIQQHVVAWIESMTPDSPRETSSAKQ